MKFLDSNRHAIMDRESPGGLNPTQRIAGYDGTVRAGETGSPMKNTPIGYPVPNSQLGKHVNNILDSADCIYVLRKIHVCIHMLLIKKRHSWI